MSKIFIKFSGSNIHISIMFFFIFFFGKDFNLLLKWAWWTTTCRFGSSYCLDSGPILSWMSFPTSVCFLFHMSLVFCLCTLLPTVAKSIWIEPNRIAYRTESNRLTCNYGIELHLFTPSRENVELWRRYICRTALLTEYGKEKTKRRKCCVRPINKGT